MIFTDYWKVLVLLFWPFRNGKYGLFSVKQLMERWNLLGLFELSMIFRDLGNMGFRAALTLNFRIILNLYFRTLLNLNFGTLLNYKLSFLTLEIHASKLSIHKKRFLTHFMTLVFFIPPEIMKNQRFLKDLEKNHWY